jgi:PAS domain S-box-containing protein
MTTGKGVSVATKVKTAKGKPRDITERKRTEEALRVSINRWQSAFDAIGNAVCLLSPEGKILRCNAAMVNLLGKPVSEIEGRTCWELVHGTSKPIEGCPIMRMKQTGRRETLTLFMGNRWFEVCVDPLLDDKGSLTGAVHTIIDITERKLKESDYQGIIRTTTDGFWIVDSKGRFVDVNDAYCALSGYSREELLNMSIPDIEAIEKPEDTARRIQRIIKTGHDRFETRHRRKDGGIIGIEISTTYAGAGDERLFVFARDITERKQAEEALQAEKNKLQSVVDALEHGLTIQDRDYNIIYQSEFSKGIFGNHPGEKCYRVYESREDLCPGCPVGKAFRDGKSHTSERRVVTPSGEVTFWENTANPIRDAGGRTVSCLELTRNVTERKQAEEALRESEERFRSVVENSHAGVMILDDAFRLTYVNPQLCKISGYSLKELIGQDFRLFLDEESRQLVADRYIRRQRGEEIPPRYEFNIIPKDGQKRRVEISSSVIKDSAGKVKTVAQILDITERKQADEALREGQEKLRRMFESVTDGITVIDLNGIITEVNQRTVEIHGFGSKDELVGRSAFALVAPADHEKITKNMHQALKQGTVRDVEYTLLRADGTEFPGELSTSVLRDASGNWVGHITIIRDIIERKRMEEELKLQRAYFQQLFDNSPDAIVLLDNTGQVVQVNRGFETLFGYRAEEIKGRLIYDIVVPEGCIEEASVLFRAALNNKALRVEKVRKRKDGSLVDVDTFGYPIRFIDNTVGVCAIYSDITRRKRMEEEEKRLQLELYRARRLAAVGELAAGVAHEINNPLTGVLGFAQRLLRKSTSEEFSRDLEIIHGEAQRAAKIVQSLLAFARRREPKKEYASINDIVQKTLELRDYALQTSNIEVTTNLAPGLPQIMVDFNQIQEVFLNIIMNAEQAMSEAGDGGKLTIKTREVKDYVRISFADDGPGIPPEQLDRVFDPFFTTRAEKGGTGLGLSAGHGIVAEHGGRIYARNRAGKGATFFIELPLHPD